MNGKRDAIGKRFGNEGMAMLYAVMVASVTAAMAWTMAQMAADTAKKAKTKNFRAQTRYLAEGAVEVAKTEIQDSIANWSAVTLNTPTATQIGTDTVNYTILEQIPQWTSTDASGIQTYITQYKIDATAAANGYTTTASRLVNAEATPIFQFAVFYTNDLEILPGANMTIGGRIHSNADAYLGSNATLTVNTNYLRTVGEIYRNRKDDPTQSPGTVNIRKWVADPFNASEPSQYFMMKSKSQMASLGVTTTSGYDNAFTTGYDANGNGSFADSGDWYPWNSGALEYWKQPTAYAGGTGNTVQTSDHGTTEAMTPQIGSIKMYDPTSSGTGGDYVLSSSGPTAGTYVPAPGGPGTGTHNKGFYHSSADLTILELPASAAASGATIPGSSASWVIQAFDKNGANVTGSLTTAISSRQMYDARQAAGTTGTKKVKLIEINMANLNSSGKFPANGLLYAARYGSGTGLSAGGVRLTNGSTLAGKLTVVSENPIYVKGDYNTTAKKGASVIGDAINLLSNAWNDSKTQGTLPVASASTTYNVAMISGNQNTAGTAYNGGLENLPRFHENWTGKNCNIYGSFVNTWLSQYATEAWVYGGDRYTAPNRNWYYDTAFNSVANLPPFTPMAVTANDIVSW